VRAARLALAGLDASVQVADVRTYPVPDAGLILIIDLLQYLEPDDQRAVLERCAASLRPGGILLVREPDTAGRWRWWVTRALDIAALRTGGSGTHPRYQSAAAFTEILERAGLSVSVQTHRNVLPLTHIVIQARRAGEAA
jgi:trans-aconitate methyltransferase